MPSCGATGSTSEQAQDLTQGFLAHILSGDQLRDADRRRGRFRSYLLGCLKHYLSDQRKHRQAQKRGGGMLPVSIDEQNAEGRYLVEPVDPGTSPEQQFDRQWAMAVLKQAMDRLEAEYLRANKAKEFEMLQDWLTGEAERGDYRKVAEALGRTEDNVRAMVRRMRLKFRESLRGLVKETVSSSGEVDSELEHLMRALS